MPFALEIPKKKKPNYFDNYSGFADSPALSVQGGGGYIRTLFKDERRICKNVDTRVTFFERLFDETIYRIELELADNPLACFECCSGCIGYGG
jgi:hypothetical protein